MKGKFAKTIGSLILIFVMVLSIGSIAVNAAVKKPITSAQAVKIISNVIKPLDKIGEVKYTPKNDLVIKGVKYYSIDYLCGYSDGTSHFHFYINSIDSGVYEIVRDEKTKSLKVGKKISLEKKAFEKYYYDMIGRIEGP